MKQSQYRYVLVESFRATGGGSRHAIRIRPLPEQGLDPEMVVECSSKMRDAHPIGTIFKIEAKVTDRKGGPPFLYTNYRWPYDILTPEQARDFLKQTK